MGGMEVSRSKGKDELSEEELSAVRKRLKSLGYL
jgi:hypothetical protein